MILRSTLLCLALVSAVPASAIPTVSRSAPSLRTLAEQGDPGAMARLGWHYYHGEGLSKDMAEAVKWFRAAAELNDRSGMFGLGVCLEEGKGIVKDEAQALSLYREAGVTQPLALYRQAAMLLDGRGTARDPGAVQALVDAGLARGEAANMLRLAAALLGSNRVADAEPLVQRVMRHPASAGARADPAFIRAVGYVGEAYRDVSRFHEAQSWLQAQIALLRKLPVQDGVAMSEALQELELTDALMRQYAMLVDFFAQANKRLSLTFDKQGGELADHYAWVAAAFELGDFFSEAEHYRRLAMKLNEEAGRLDTVRAVDNLASLGSVLYGLGRYEEAAAVLAQAADRMGAVRSEENRVQWHVLSELGTVQLTLGRLDAAEASYRKLLALSENHRGFGTNRMRGAALQGLGKVYVRLRRYEEAHAMLQQALAIQVEVPKRLRYGAASTMLAIGKLFMETENFRQAEGYLARALTTMVDIPSSAGWNAAEVLHAMGSNYAKQGDHGLAASHFERALHMRLLVRRNHHLTRESGAALVAAYRSLGKENIAQELEMRLEGAAKNPEQEAVAGASQARS